MKIHVCRKGGYLHDDLDPKAEAAWLRLPEELREALVRARPARDMPGSVDRALWRRFDVHVPFAKPSREMVARYVAGRARPSLAVEGPDGGHDYAAAAADGGLSVADVERAFDRCARAAVMAGGAAVRAEDLLRAVRAEAEATPGAGGAT